MLSPSGVARASSVELKWLIVWLTEQNDKVFLKQRRGLYHKQLNGWRECSDQKRWHEDDGIVSKAYYHAPYMSLTLGRP